MNKLNLEGIHLDMDELIKKYMASFIHELEANKL